MWKDALVIALLSLGVLVELLCCLGVIFMPHLFDRLHYLAPASSVGPALIAGAVVTREALNHQGILAVLVAVFLMVFGPVLAHATARAARIRDLGDWRPRPEEGVRRA